MTHGPEPVVLAPNAKLTQQQREQIRERRAAGERVIDLAAEFGVKKRTIIRIAATEKPVAYSTEPFAWHRIQELYQGGKA